MCCWISAGLRNRTLHDICKSFSQTYQGEAAHLVPSCPGLSEMSNHFGPSLSRSLLKSKLSFFCRATQSLSHGILSR